MRTRTQDLAVEDGTESEIEEEKEHPLDESVAAMEDLIGSDLIGCHGKMKMVTQDANLSGILNKIKNTNTMTAALSSENTQTPQLKLSSQTQQR